MSHLRLTHQRRADRLTLACIAVTVLVLGFGLLSVSGKHDAEIVFGYLGFLAFIFVSAPLHLIGGAVAVVSAWRCGNHRRNSWIYAYFTLFVVVHGGIFVASGLHEPIVEFAQQSAYRATHAHEIALIRAVQGQRQGDLEELKALLDAGADPDTRDRQFQVSALMWAAYKGNREAVALLLAAGADASVRLSQVRWGVDSKYSVELAEQTAVMFAGWASSGDRAGTLQALLDAGGEPSGYALMGTCRYGDLAAFRLLADAGAALSDQDDDGHTCLHLAAMEGHLVLIRELLERGASTEPTHKWRGTALDAAAGANQHEAVMVLIRNGAPSVHAGKLLEYAAGRDEDEFRALEGTSALTTAASMGGKALMQALTTCEAIKVQRLIELGIDPNVKADGGRTALHLLTHSSCRNRDALAGQLVSDGADLEQRDDGGMTPLAFAAYRNQLDYVRALLALGAHIDAPVARGPAQHPTVLERFAGDARYLELSVLLLTNGATLTDEAEARLRKLAASGTSTARKERLLELLDRARRDNSA